MKIFPPSDYGDKYSEDKLFAKLKMIPGKVLITVVVKASILYELLKQHDTPLVVKAAIIATLGYLISPIDGICDLIPGGYIDDIALMAGLLAGSDHLISNELKKQGERGASSMIGQ